MSDIDDLELRYFDEDHDDSIPSISPPICPYCNKRTILVSYKQIIDLAELKPNSKKAHLGKAYLCHPCKAWVGCHVGTTTPLGTPAKEALRKLRIKAHSAFDTLWKVEGMTRKKAYAFLQEILKLPEEKAHIAMLREGHCRRLIKVLQERERKLW